LAEGKVELVRRKTKKSRNVDVHKAAASIAESILEERSFAPAL
jgi:hypothetical protein